MQIKEIIKISALLLGRTNVIDYLDQKENCGEDALPTVNTFVGLSNLVINELACTYIPMCKTETVNVEGGKLYYGQLSERALKIRAVYNEDGKSVSFSEKPEYIDCPYSQVSVEYEFAPSNYGLEDEIGYMEKDVPARVIAYGVAAEFCISEGLFEQAITHHDRYVFALSEICVPKNATIKRRGFI